MTDESAVKPKQDKSKKYILVRHGRMNTLDWFEHELANIPKVPSRAIVKTEKGLELGEIVGQLNTYKGGQFKLNKLQVQKYFEDSEIEFTGESAGVLVRLAEADDISEDKHLRKIANEEVEFCKQQVKSLNLPMKIIGAEHIFGGERIIFYFMAESRVDFRTLVKNLAQAYQTRIEMRQIGSRDEAKMLGDYETCGQQCCCQRFLKALKPVNMRMAKMQKATLDPSKISGYCGRLKCCLRYEDETYTELKKRLPRKGSMIKTAQGQALVIDGNILTQLVVVQYEDGKREAIPLEELETGRRKEPQKEPQEPVAEEEIQESEETGGSGEMNEDITQ